MSSASAIIIAGFLIWLGLLAVTSSLKELARAIGAQR